MISAWVRRAAVAQTAGDVTVDRYRVVACHVMVGVTCDMYTVQLVRDMYNDRRQLVSEYSRARCDTSHAVVVPPTTTQLVIIRVHRGRTVFLIHSVLRYIKACCTSSSCRRPRHSSSLSEFTEVCSLLLTTYVFAAVQIWLRRARRWLI